MNERPTGTVPAEIEEAQLQFENRRRERKRGERIPQNLWVTAVALAKEHGVWPTARGGLASRGICKNGRARQEHDRGQSWKAAPDRRLRFAYRRY